MIVTTTAAAPEVITEAVPHTNGVREAVEQEQCQLGVVNGNMDVDSAPIVAPLLHDVDLEKMHVDLYRGRYLTPQDFLDDISKIVQNSELRAFEDMDRMYKAQAMLIATQVSIQEFDPAFKLECERMAVREHQRREERRKNKEKGKEKEEAVTRRSTRIPGQTLEISIMDPVKLERRLKRQRGPSAGSSHEGEEDGQGADEQERESKRSRMSTEENERVSSEEAGQATHVRAVHFAASTEVVGSSQPIQTFGDASAATVLEPMIVDTVPSSGFDPTLLNPLPSTENVFGMSRTASPAIKQPASTVAINASSSSLPAPLVYNLDSQLESDIPPALLVTTNSKPSLVSPQVIDHHGHGNFRTPSPRQHTSRCRTKTPEDLPITTQDPSPVIVERLPTPLPQFHVDEMLLSELHQQLAKTTAPLNIEQLEQLRATCLESVWRHRIDWERDGVVRELMEQVERFVEEVTDPDDL